MSPIRKDDLEGYLEDSGTSSTNSLNVDICELCLIGKIIGQKKCIEGISRFLPAKNSIIFDLYSLRE